MGGGGGDTKEIKHNKFFGMREQIKQIYKKEVLNGWKRGGEMCRQNIAVNMGGCEE